MPDYMQRLQAAASATAPIAEDDYAARLNPTVIEPLGILPAIDQTALGAGRGGMIIRKPGQNIGSEELGSLSRSGRLYRGMTKEEYEATVGSGAGVKSRQDFSVKKEGTSFAGDVPSAESYVNFGRDDPRVTGKPTYLVEIDGQGIAMDRDGYFKAHAAIGPERITRVLEMTGTQDGSIVARDITPVRTKP